MLSKNLSLYLVLLILFSGCQAPIKENSMEEVKAPSKEFYELRNYELSSPEQFEAVATFLKDAAIPALKRQGIGPIGMFSPLDTAKDGNYISLLLPFSNLDVFAELQDKMMQDQAYLSSGAAHLDMAHPAKAFERIDSRLLIAFDSMPKMEVPAIHSNPDRVFELRSYESYSEKKGIAKVKMFDAGGEVTIFKDLGFYPVFFARALTGDEQPNLIYMVSYKDATEETRKAQWTSFGNDDRWKAIKDLEEYANTVSKIHSIMLKPLPGSEI
ncbi:MAG: NIPSNAP family protein [Bacteroidia bacterium]|nr:NIPSNAP family protein [Bacteroidia bacterium]